MSTRGAIARSYEIAPDVMGFRGVYHHWDSYPEGLGATLFDLYNGLFRRDLEKMLAVLIDQHPAGWSSINGADWTLPAGFKDRGDSPCAECGKDLAAHYRQYMKRPTAKDKAEMAQGNYMRLGHSHVAVEQPTGPECYCHGSRAETANDIDDSNASSCGVEYVYTFDVGQSQMYILSSFNRDGDKMIGMFGCGDPNATWHTIAVVDLDAPEPNWEKITEDQSEIA
jgi:hypothetical protein